MCSANIILHEQKRDAMLPIVAKRELKLKAAKIEAYIIFHSGKSTVPCTSPSQISEVLCSKTLNVWHDLRSSFWKHLLRRRPYLISFEHLLSCIGLIWWRVSREGCRVVWCHLLQVADSILDTFTHLHTFFHQCIFKQPSPFCPPASTHSSRPLCVVTAVRDVHSSLMSVNWKQKQIKCISKLPDYLPICSCLGNSYTQCGLEGLKERQANIYWQVWHKISRYRGNTGKRHEEV